MGGGSFSPSFVSFLVQGPPGGGGPPGTPIMPSPGGATAWAGWGGVCLPGETLPPQPLTPQSPPPDSTNSGESMYTIMNPVGPGAGRANVSVGSRVGAAEGGGSAGDLVARVPRCPPARSSRSALVRRAPWRP